MASTITLSGDWLISIGNRNQTYGTGNLGTYATNGVAVSASQLGLGQIQSFIIDPAGGYTFEYVPATGKVKAYYGNSGVAAHTHDVLIKGGQAAAGTAAVATYATNILGKEAATDVTIAGADSATKGGVQASAAPSGSAATEVANSTNLAGITFTWTAIGY